MNTYIQLAFGVSTKIILNTYTYFSYFLAVFTFLFETFPYNMLTALTIAIFFVRYKVKRAGSNIFSLQVWRERSEEMEELIKRVESMTSRVTEKMEVTRKKVKNAKQAKYDERIVKDLERQMRSNDKELEVLQIQFEEMRKYAKGHLSEIREQVKLKNELQLLLFCTQKYKEAQGKVASFFERNVRKRIEPIVFRVYCILI